MEKDLKGLKKLWNSRNPHHDIDQEGQDRFWETAHLVFEEYLKFLNASENNNKLKDDVEWQLISLWSKIGMDTPNNYEDIVQYCFEDILDTASPLEVNSENVAVAFRRWVESKI